MWIENKTRTSKVGATSKAQKAQNIIFEKSNIHSVAKYQISKKLKGGPFGGNFFQVSQCRKTERGTLSDFSTSILSQNMKKSMKKLFSRKNLTMPKTTERGVPLGFFNIHSVAKHQKNAGGPLKKKIPKKMSRSAEKN